MHACTCTIIIYHYRRYHVSKRRIIPLPRYKVDPKLHPQALFKPKQVHALIYTVDVCIHIYKYVAYMNVYIQVEYFTQLNVFLSVKMKGCVSYKTCDQWVYQIMIVC